MGTAVVASQVPAVEPSSSGQLDWHIVVESLTDGQVAAWIAQWPDCRVVAGSRDEAVEAVRSALNQRMGTIEVLPVMIDVVVPEFWAEKQRSHDDDEILSLEDFLKEG
jgi:hypothetical protein